MKVWIAKYALTKGIFEIQVEQLGVDGQCVHGKAWNDSYYGEGREWHRTKESAIVKAKEMRQKKIESLKKQIEKLEELTFE